MKTEYKIVVHKVSPGPTCGYHSPAGWYVDYGYDSKTSIKKRFWLRRLVDNAIWKENHGDTLYWEGENREDSI